VHTRLFLVIFQLLAAILWLAGTVAAQDPLTYTVHYDVGRYPTLKITIKLPSSSCGAGAAAPLNMIMPRTIPGGYVQRPYDQYVLNVFARNTKGLASDIRRVEYAPRWIVGAAGECIDVVEYEVDLKRMEREILSASDSSKMRENYVGLLGYSVFAFIERREHEPIRLEIDSRAPWPVFSTLAPQVPAPISKLIAQATDYYALADSQVLMGDRLKLEQFPSSSSVPLYVAVYSETESDLHQEGVLARDAMEKLIAYFGKAPFTHYTVSLELLKPLDRHEYNFSMEHLESGTFSFSADRALTARTRPGENESRRFNYAHHIAHSWIPKRAYGEHYLPFQWEMTPLIDTIWFNEGFGRYVAIEALAEALPPDKTAAYRKERLDRLQGIVDSAPAFLRAMSLSDLSREGSFLYAEDFRTGMNLFSRGALIAAAMDDEIRQETYNQKSLRDALRHLLDWTAQNQRAFRVEELPQILREATGVDVTPILNQALQPLPPIP
jgi:predicted metalloprotease with PDZ domain